MEKIYHRLKKLRTVLNLSQRKFSKLIYISQSLYSAVELGHRETSDRIIQLISSRLNVSKDWILKGKGEMFTAPPPDIDFERLTEIYNKLDGMLKKCLLEQSDMLLRIQRETINKKGRASSSP
jgi:transcriptional regulator with XRE-family HTH domain